MLIRNKTNSNNISIVTLQSWIMSSVTTADFDISQLGDLLPVKFSKLTPEGTLQATFGESSEPDFPGKYIIVVSPQNSTDDRQIYSVNTFNELENFILDFIQGGWSYVAPPQEKLVNTDGSEMTGKQKKKLRRYVERQRKKEERKNRKRK